MLVVDGVDVWRRDREILRSVSLELESGEVAAVTGASGSGKSTLLSAIMGFVPLRAGRIAIGGLDVPKVGSSAWRAIRLHDLGFVSQRGDLVPELHVWENVALPLRFAGVAVADSRAQALAALERVGLSSLADSRAASLSGGEWMRCAFARAVIARPRVVLADEPTGALDRSSSLMVGAELLALANDVGATVLVATHDPLIAELATSEYHLVDGDLVKAR